jgi:hypothetical protein
MRGGYKAIFSDAAREYNVSILVRAANPASLKYVGMQGFCPKPLDCKAMDRMSGTPEKYGVKKIAVLHSPSSAPGFEDFAIRWFERKFAK